MSMIGLGLPYESESIIGEIVDGEKLVYREIFDAQSWAEFPKRVPWLRSHQRSQAALGWATVESKPGGLFALIDPVAGSSAANDAIAEVRAGVVRGLSVGFWPDPNSDVIDARNRRRLPLIRRRNATLREISLALTPAYPTAGITSVDADATAHAESEELLAPLRREAEVELEAKRARDAELLRWLDELEPTRWSEPEPVVAAQKVPWNFPEPTSLVRIAGETFRVADGADPAYAVDQYMSLVVESIHRAGRGLRADEMHALQVRSGISTVQ